MIRSRTHLFLVIFVLGLLGLAVSKPRAGEATALPMGSAPEPIAFRHFPDRLHAFVFRNWTLVEPAHLAKVLRTSPANVIELATSMGLPSARSTQSDFIRRGYITLLRRNWHLLPYEQLLELVEMREAELAAALFEDDFLFVKFGSLKPDCDRLLWVPPDPVARRRAKRIATMLRDEFGNSLNTPGEPRYAFVERLSAPLKDWRRPMVDREPLFRMRFIYSYFGLFGDPLMDPELSAYPEGLLQRLASVGVDGVWLHTVLRHLAPGGEPFPELGRNSEVRLDNLRRLVRRAREYGIGVYLYLNEPRALPHDLMAAHPEVAGVREGDLTALCSSAPAVRAWLAQGLEHVFANVPGLAGVFTISASENLTHCASHGKQAECIRCRSSSYAELIAGVNAAIERGVHAGDPQARVIVWDWGWHGHGEAPDVIAALPEKVWLMSVSEWSLPIERGGVKSRVGEYSLSAAGPGPRARRHWELARARGLNTVAKVQLNTTWEASPIPYLPVLDLVAEHCERLARSGVDGMMLSWTVGGFPSPNLEIARQFSVKPTPRKEDVLEKIARDRFGAGASEAREAWRRFSDAFRQYPYHVSVLYHAPVQLGPANLLYPVKTGYRATMVGIPYDDVDTWRGPYPRDTLAEEFEKVAEGWRRGLGHLEMAVSEAPPALREDAEAELRFARTAALLFESTANQVRFVLHRDALTPDGQSRGAHRAEMIRIARREFELAKELFALAREDSRIGFEAANHYFFLPIDLLEKMVNCEYVIDHFSESRRPQ